MPDSDSHTAQDIRNACLRLLTRREHSQQELLDKLSIKGFEKSELQAIIDRLAEQGWQSNQRFTESYSRYRIKKGYGPIKIAFELQQRGIKETEVDPVALDLADSWDEIIDSVYLKKYAGDKKLAHKEWLKRSRFLQQRGFNNEMINQLFKRFIIQLYYD